MPMTWKEEHLDVILVPASLFLMFGYHLFLLYQYKRYEDRTTFGHENHCKRLWVERMLKTQPRDPKIAVSVISSNLSGAITLSSICIVLSSLIGAWIANNSRNIFKSSMIYGDTGESIISIKYICLLACLLVAFTSFVQAARCSVNANFLISMPYVDMPMELIQKPVIQMSAFWAIGVRALHFAATFLFWVFGPIPMFASSVITVVLLYTQDRTNKPLNQFQPDLLKKDGQGIEAQVGLAPGIEAQVGLTPGIEAQARLARGIEPQVGSAPGIEAQVVLAPGIEAQVRLTPGIEAQVGLAPGIEAQVGLTPGIEAQARLARGIEPQVGSAPGIEAQVVLAPGIEAQVRLTPGIEAQVGLAV